MSINPDPKPTDTQPPASNLDNAVEHGISSALNYTNNVKDAVIGVKTSSDTEAKVKFHTQLAGYLGILALVSMLIGIPVSIIFNLLPSILNPWCWIGMILALGTFLLLLAIEAPSLWKTLKIKTGEYWAERLEETKGSTLNFLNNQQTRGAAYILASVLVIFTPFDGTILTIGLFFVMCCGAYHIFIYRSFVMKLESVPTEEGVAVEAV